MSVVSKQPSERPTGGRTRIFVAMAVALLVGMLFLWPESDGERRADDGSHSLLDSEAAGDPKVVYTCGMHPHVISSEQGHCPICGMDLVPAAAPPTRKIKHWRAPMDPNYVSDKPGKSPMGMDLVPVYEDESDESGGASIAISPVVVQNMGVRTAPVAREALKRTVRTVGTIEYDEQLVRDVTTKFHGWIEELYAHYTGQHIDVGMPLFRVFSRELYSSQEEYLLALRNKDRINAEAMPSAAADMTQLVESARLRLELFDISDQQIDELQERGLPSKTLTVTSPYAGVIVEKQARDGMHVDPGTKLYTIADLSRVWVAIDIYENEVPFVKLGQQARMNLSHLPGRPFTGKVIYVYPFVDESTRTVKVRMEFDNPHLELKPGMFADVEIVADTARSGLVVPRAAVIDTGERQVAFVVLGEGRFEPRTVTIGLDVGDDKTEVVAGLDEGELVVTSGQFLLDSESKLREAVAKMGGESAEPASREPEPRSSAQPARGQSRPAMHMTAPRLAEPVRSAIRAYFGLHAVLAEDERDGLADAVAEIHQRLGVVSAAASVDDPAEEVVAELAARATEAVIGMSGRSIDAVRAQFSELSAHLVDIIRLVGHDALALEFHAFHCPMAGAGWIQSAPQPANPYYGFAMPACGEAVDITSLVR